MRRGGFRIAVVLLAPWLGIHAPYLAVADDSVPKCLYGAFTQDEEKTPIQPCGADQKRVGADDRVLAVMRTFGIPRDIVVFQACPGGRFSAMPDGNATNRFLIRYPSDVAANYLAPIVHELAHVVQMRNAGGLAALKPTENSRRIELGADFLAGLAFNIALADLNSGDFETNLQLAGSYKVETDDHGTPEHRTIAFRFGSNRKEPYSDMTIIEAMTYWNANDYARIRR